MPNWHLNETPLDSRMLLGTALYPSLDIMQQSVKAAQSEVVTVSLRRQMPEKSKGNAFWDQVRALNCHVLPNTAGCKNAREAVTTAQMAREIFETNWVKLEVIGDDYNLQPDPFELVKAAEQLLSLGFFVMPYCTDDLVLCKSLTQLGCDVVMPWASPIGSGQGLLNTYALRTLRERLPDSTLIVDAGLGAPSDAAKAMEMGFDGVLLNSAVALAHDPVSMAQAFAEAVRAGRQAFEAGIMPKRDVASPSTPTIDMPFWQQDKSES